MRLNFVSREPVILSSLNGETIAVYGKREVKKNIWNPQKNIYEDGLHVWQNGGYQLVEARDYRHEIFSDFEMDERGEQITFLRDLNLIYL